MTIAIVDDHPVVIEGLRTLLKDNKTVSFTRAGDFIDYVKSNWVDIVLLDITLPDGNGIDFCREIKNISPATIVLGLSNLAERSIILQMLQNGASGYLLKNAAADELMKCIEEAKKGGVAFSNEVKEILAKPTRAELRTAPSVTKREKEILQLLSRGMTTASIATGLNLSPLTVDTHRRNLLQKFDVKNTAELLMAAVEQKLL